MDAFRQLNSRRQVGMAECPIPPTEIESYSKQNGFDHDATFFYRAITALDDTLLKHRAEERELEEKRNKARKGSKR